MFFKDLNGGVYDVYDLCIVIGISETELEILVKILKLKSI